MSLRPATLPPGPRFPLSSLGAVAAFARDPLGVLEQLAFGGHGDLAYLHLPGLHAYALNHPSLVEHVLVTHSRRYPKDRVQKDLLRPLFGNGLLLSEGDFWLSQRRLMQPAFHRQRIASYAQLMVGQARTLAASWQHGQVRDVYADMSQLTLDIVLRALFGVDSSGEAQAVGPALSRVMEYFAKLSIAYLPSWLPTPSNLAFRSALRRLDAAVLDIVRRRRAQGSDTGDLMSLLLHAQAEDGSRMSDSQLRDEVLTLVLAGHETTAITLAFCWHLLARHPAAEAALHRELDSVLQSRDPTVEDLPSLPYTEHVVKESLRLYPPAWSLSREAAEQDTLAGFPLPAGAMVMISPWTLHRDARFFEQPLAFRPERWEGGLEQRLPRFAFCPFGGGSRLCIGVNFALVEARLALATLARRFRLEADYPGEPALLPSITLRPRHGLRMRLHAR